MTMILDDSMVSRAENDYKKITEISALGSLADTVLREIIIIEADAVDAPLVGIPMAARFFRDVSAELNRPRNIWDTPSSAHELLHFTGSGTATPTVGAQDSVDLRPWLDQVANALECAASGRPSAEAIGTVRREFTQIADDTMRSAAQLASTRYLPA